MSYLFLGLFIVILLFVFILMPAAFRADNRELSRRRIASAGTDDPTVIAQYVVDALDIAEERRLTLALKTALEGEENSISSRAYLYSIARALQYAEANLQLLAIYRTNHPCTRAADALLRLIPVVLQRPEKYMESAEREAAIAKAYAAVQGTGYLASTSETVPQTA